ncbi:hypothetical protein FACS189423_03720 [Bacteroidia bacterium]|nr:hypothetical protein FACS189423_03720 [Bacteroidia bacterium]
MNGSINDTLPINVFFDTGASFSAIGLCDSLKDLLGEDKQFLQIGDIKKEMDVFYLKRENSIFQRRGTNTAYIGWRFFADNILEISFQHKYIRKLKEATELNGYKCIKIDTVPFLRIPVEIYLQEKMIKEDVIIDTGNDGFLDLFYNTIKKHSILIDSTQTEKVNTAQIGSYETFFVDGDSVKAGYAVPFQYHLRFFKAPECPFSGLIGTAFLDKFDVVLDLKDFYLYLKPIEKEEK